MKYKRSKPKTPKKLAWDAFSRYIRLRDCLKTTNTLHAGECITCKRIYPYKKLQAGHFVPGRGNAVLFDEMGVNAQCVQCNFYKHGDPLIYRQVLVQRHGEETVQALELKRKMTKKLRKEGYILLCKYYDDKAKELEALNAL